MNILFIVLKLNLPIFSWNLCNSFVNVIFSITILISNYIHSFMKTNKSIVLCSLLLLFLSIGMVSANENITIEGAELSAENNIMNTLGYTDFEEGIMDSSIGYGESEQLSDFTDDYDYEEYNSVIIDTTEFSDDLDDEGNHILDYEDQLIKFKVRDDEGYTGDAYSCMEDENGNEYNVCWDDDNEYYWVEDKLPVGKHEVTVFLDDYYYTAEPLVYSVLVEKSYFKGDVICKSYYSTDKSTVTMKATVKDSYGYRENGKVTFKVNGKSYTVKTKNGVATKTIKIKKAGTYTYTATFKSGNYWDVGVGKGKLYVYSTSKNARTFYIKGYKVVVPVNKYKGLVNAKNTGKWYYLHLKTSKYVKQRVGHYKNNLKTVKASVLIIVSYGGKNGGQYGTPNKYALFLTTPYQNPGYDYCTPWIYGAKKSTVINKLNNAKTTKW